LADTQRPDGLPPEPKGRAILLGLRYVAAEPNVRAAMVRSLAFYGMASAIWALLPLYVRQVLGLSATGYGVMLGATGAGAVLGGMVMPHLNNRLSRDNQVVLGGIVCSATLIPVALLPSPGVAGCAMIVFGCGWILAASNLMAAVQLASAPWVRARGVAVYQAIFNGGMGIGAIIWGWLAESAGLSGTILAAALGGIGMALVGRTHPLSDEIDDPSLPPAVAPPTIVAHETMASMLSSLRHPVVVTIAYTIDHENADDFRAAMMKVAAARRRDGATAWVLGRDVEQPERWLEAFRLPDWMELSRGVARVNLVDAAATQAARSFHCSERPPEVRVMIIEQG
jgi:MFS family permease